MLIRNLRLTIKRKIMLIKISVELRFNFLLIFTGGVLLANFGIAITYEKFVTLSLLLSIPVCAGKYFCYIIHTGTS